MKKQKAYNIKNCARPLKHEIQGANFPLQSTFEGKTIFHISHAFAFHFSTHVKIPRSIQIKSNITAMC